MEKKKVIESLTNLVNCVLNDFKTRYPGNAYQGFNETVTNPIENELGTGWTYEQASLMNWNAIFNAIFGPIHSSFPDKDVYKNFLESVEYFGGQEVVLFHYSTVSQILSNIFTLYDPSWLDSQTEDLKNKISSEVEKIISKRKIIEVNYILSGIEINKAIEFEGFSLIPLTTELKKDLYITAQINDHFASRDAFNVAGDNILWAHAVLVGRFDAPWEQTDNPGKENHTRIDSVIQAIRFTHTGPVFISGKFFGVKNSFYAPSFFEGEVRHSPHEKIPFPLERFEDIINYFLGSKENIQKLEIIIERIQDLSRKPRNQNHQIFDYISICESIVVGSNEGEFSYKVPLHMTNLTSMSFEGQNLERFNLFRRCYSIRSKIAHCSKVKPKDEISKESFEHLKETVHHLLLLTIQEGLDSVRTKAKELALNIS